MALENIGHVHAHVTGIAHLERSDVDVEIRAVIV
jgi:hypothetical protein